MVTMFFKYFALYANYLSKLLITIYLTIIQLEITRGVHGNSRIKPRN